MSDESRASSDDDFCEEVNVGSKKQVNGKSNSKQTIEKIYQKKSQLEHILLRPDTYIGSVEKCTETMWVYDFEKKCMVERTITFVPGLYKIFDEILVNAADNKQRDNKMDCIKIDIDREKNSIKIYNNGQGIPVVKHKEENMYVPTMIFGHLLTSSNYNDDEEKVTGGRNGYGAKLCNIFSREFIVETVSKEYGKQFKQTWRKNMSEALPEIIKDTTQSDFTKITFTPDLAKFKMDTLDDDIVALMSRRAFDVAASSRGVKVFLNGDRLPIRSFKDYIDFYLKSQNEESNEHQKIVHEIVNERWEVAVVRSDCGFKQVSFVNSIATTKGGRHVEYVCDNIIKNLLESVKKKNKGGTNIKPYQVKTHLWVFINCLIVNPTFDSQTKENMTLQVKNFGSKCPLSDKFITAVNKIGIIESVLSWAKFKEQTELQKKSGAKKTKLKGLPKLEDANEAGTKNAHKCTLILTEGDSAKSLAISGLSVIGRDNYGVFPLKGKLLNVREATHKQILENPEINNLIKIVGLIYKKQYQSLDDIKTLRYGKIMIMTDQDQDGSHIKGLLINFVHYNWPSLLRMNFLEEFITPIVKVRKAKRELSFFSIPEFEEWKQNTPTYKTYDIKYYKGLGTSSAQEAREYFSNLSRHRINFYYSGTEDDSNIEMAFSKRDVEKRKEWINNFMIDSKRRKLEGIPDKYLYEKDTRQISYSDFVNLELIHFSNMDNVRSIPCVIDGLKPGQRKILYTCLKRNDRKEIKVGQLSGAVTESTAYHHGEASLHMAIVNMAQDFVGSNNINLLLPGGQFGTRLQGGKDAASYRYIFTKLSPVTRLIFHPHDDAILDFMYEDNKRVEPKFYVPIIPMVLANGAEGIGTGWSTKILNYNPKDLIKNMELLLDDKEIIPLKPWYRGFIGTIENIADQRYVINGEVSIIDEDTIEITELPVGTWTHPYRENILDTLLHGNDKLKPILSDYKEYSSETVVRFIITFLPGELRKAEKDGGLHKLFKLQTMCSVSNMCAFDELDALLHYESTSKILKEFYALRLRYYQKRKDYYVGMLEAEALRLGNQARFILEKCSGEVKVENMKKKDMIAQLVAKKYDADPVMIWKEKNLKASQVDDEDEVAEEEEEAEEQDAKKYDYLVGMTMWMLTAERKDKLLKERDEKKRELEELKSKTIKELWRSDLKALSAKLNEMEVATKKLRDKDQDYKPKKGGKLIDRIKAQKAFECTTATRVEPVITFELKKKAETASKNSSKGRAKNDEVKTEKGSKKKTSPITGSDDSISTGEKSKENAVTSISSSPESDAKPLKKPRAKKGAKKLLSDSDTGDQSVEKPKAKKMKITKPSDAEAVEKKQPAKKKTTASATSSKKAAKPTMILASDSEGSVVEMDLSDQSDSSVKQTIASTRPRREIKKAAPILIDSSDSESDVGRNLKKKTKRVCEILDSDSD